MILRNDHVFLTTAPEMKEITKPLLSLGINYFGYSRYYNNGGRLWLCNRQESIANYYAYKDYRIGNTESHPRNFQSQVVLWSTLPNQLVYEHARQINIDHGIYLIEPQKDCCEFYSFATTPDKYQIINTYLTNIDYLKKFAEYFKETARSLIKVGEQNKIFLPYHDKKIPRVSNINLDLLHDDKASHQAKLSLRQHSCAQMLLQGKTIKEMAKKLSLSPRTIETYINNLKFKLKCQNKIELILKLSEYI